MDNKRGQVTIFIILAVLIIGGVALFFTLKGGIHKESSLAPEAVPIKNFVEGCLDDSLEEAVYRIGENGGYSNPESVDSTPILNIPYYLKNGQNLMPSLEQIQAEISKEVSKELVLCTGDFVLFPDYKITKGKIIATTTINPESVSVSVSYPLSIRKGNSSSKIEDFESEIPVRFGIVYNSILEFINEEKTSSGGSCVDCLVDILDKNNLYMSSFDWDNYTRIFILRDLDSKINGEEFVYNFANEYS